MLLFISLLLLLFIVIVAKKDGSKKGSSAKSAPNRPSKAGKVAGKRRVNSKEKKNASDSDVLAVTLVVGSSAGSDTDRPRVKREKVQKKKKRSIRCPKGSPQIYLCEVCSKEDCGECSNCK